MDTNSSLVIDVLKASAEALDKQDQPAAIATLGTITHEVDRLTKAADGLKLSAQQSQVAAVAQVSDLIKQEGQAHAELTQAKAEANATAAQIVVKQTAIQNLGSDIAKNNAEIQTLRAKLEALQRQKNSVNDTSVGSIFKSIATLGLDRAVQAISNEINNVSGNINTTNTTLTANVEHCQRLQAELNNDIATLKQLNAAVDQKTQAIRNLSAQEAKLHQQEAEGQQREAFFTQMDLFYIKLQNLLTNIVHRIDDVRDIVAELDSTTPTIASFDPSQQNMLSLKQALVMFEGTAAQAPQ